MEQAELELLIDRLEGYARRHPTLYRLRVALLAMLGYAYLLTVVVLLLLIVYLILANARFNALTIKVIWIPLVIAGLIMRSLWVTIPEPDGKELHRDQAPRLSDLVQEVRQKLKGPKVHQILLSDEFNAGIVQIPRFGMFGWLRNYLVVGLPLLHALTPEEFRSVLAHEFGHLSGKHGRFSGWIYRVRASWIEILTRINQERNYASFIFEWFLNWYAPFFNAYSFVLARAQEYEADAYSVDLAGKHVACRALVHMSTRERSLQEEFWPGFFHLARDENKTPKDPFSQMLLGFDKSTSAIKAEKWFVEELKVKTGHGDTHPALSDRLAAMGVPRESQEIAAFDWIKPNGESESAARFYLKDLPDDLIDGYNRLWRERIVKPWHERHDYFQQMRKRFDELEEKEKSAALSVDEKWERARALGEISERSATLPLLRNILQEKPDHVGANFALGAVLLETNDASGIEYLEKASQLEPFTASDACELISNFHLEHGRKDEAQVYRKQAEQYHERNQKQLEELGNFSASDHFEPHSLTAEQLAVLQSQLKKVRGLKRAYLVRKIPKEGAQPFYVLGVVAGYTWREGDSEKDYESLINDLYALVELSGLTTFAPLEENQKYLEDILRQIPNAEVFMTDELDHDNAEHYRY